MVKRLKLNFILQSADEKLKSLGSKHHHHGSKLSIQTNTSSKSSLITETVPTNSEAKPSTQTVKQQLTPSPSVESTRVETVAGNQKTHHWIQNTETRKRKQNNKYTNKKNWPEENT